MQNLHHRTRSRDALSPLYPNPHLKHSSIQVRPGHTRGGQIKNSISISPAHKDTGGAKSEAGQRTHIKVDYSQKQRAAQTPMARSRSRRARCAVGEAP